MSYEWIGAGIVMTGVLITASLLALTTWMNREKKPIVRLQVWSDSTMPCPDCRGRSFWCGPVDSFKGVAVECTTCSHRYYVELTAPNIARIVKDLGREKRTRNDQ